MSTILIFDNGNADSGVPMTLDLSKLPAFKSLLQQVASLYPGTDRLFHAQTGDRISQLSELFHNGSYVAASNSKFIPAEYGKANGLASALTIKAVLNESKSAASAKSVVITSQMMDKYEDVLEEIARALGVYQVSELHTYSGRQIYKSKDLVNGKVYVATLPGEEFKSRGTDRGTELPALVSMSPPAVKALPRDVVMPTVEFPPIRNVSPTRQPPAAKPVPVAISPSGGKRASIAEGTLQPQLRHVEEYDTLIPDIVGMMQEDDLTIDDMAKMIQVRFMGPYQAALKGELGHWENGEDSLVALIILVDQVPRIITRHKVDSYKHDYLSRAIVRRAHASGLLKKLSNEQIFFPCLALSRQEDLECQRLCNNIWHSREFDAETEEHLISMQDAFEQSLWIIETFGRFPQYNEDLGRESTRAEKKFLAKPQNV